MNSDVLAEIFLRLPPKSLLQLKAVCKFWRHVIDSSVFRKMYTRNCNNYDRSDDEVELSFSVFNRKVRVQTKNKSFIGHTQVMGVICICNERMVPVAICDPYLRQLILLPQPSAYPGPCQISCPDAAIGLVGEDFKVVQLMLCGRHNCVHARLYSRKTDCWRELGIDGVVDGAYNSVIPIKSLSKNGHFAHWRLDSRKGDSVSRIVSFDMKNEVFQTIKLPPDYVSDYVSDYVTTTIIAKDDSFQLFYRSIFHDKFVTIYESRCEGRELSWNDAFDVEVLDIYGIRDLWWTNGCVTLELCSSVFVYDYRDRKFIRRLYGMRKGWSQSFEYEDTAPFCGYYRIQF